MEEISRQRQPPIRKPTLLGARLQMCLLLVGGIVAMLIHHFFYAFLNHRLANGNTFSHVRNAFHSTISDQSFVNAIANATATVGKICLAGAIGIAFTQVFWWRMRKTGYTLDQIDTVTSFKENPVDPTTWSAWYYSTLLALVAICSSLMEAVTIATPGSLTVASTTIEEDCSIPLVDIMNAAPIETLPVFLVDGHEMDPPDSPDWFRYVDPSSVTLELIASVLLTGSYISPASPCGVCSYHISFVAPVLQCQDDPDPIDAANINITLPIDPDGPTTVWNATAQYQWPSIPNYFNSINFSIASRSILEGTTTPVGDPVSFTCSGYNATYHVEIQQNQTTTMTLTGLDVSPVVLGPSAAPDASLIMTVAIWDAFTQQLGGSIDWTIAGGSSVQQGYENSIIMNSPLVSNRSSGVSWGWQTDLRTAIPSLMQNVSLSLASGVLANITNSTSPMQETICLVTDLHFVYDRVRLLGTYCAAIAVTVVCLAFGLYAVHRNKVAETMDLSRVLGGIASFRNGLEPRGDIKAYLDKRLQVQIDGDEYEYEYEPGAELTDDERKAPLMSDVY
ncbi:hypothetical protein EW026_g7291 [Hermanssonia centrifuga]|uniref:Uncharacterized protein n=1 Tax=Hermanssonia centrifuga TaxID=98765 RepID=A0A4S4KA44_9APHY|nr:hypothetical protein EW026_g7291 [Hermanssonia centrifuga]